jgi:hypothetical protein
VLTSYVWTEKTPKSAKKAKEEESDSEADGVKKEEPVAEI